MTLDQKLAEIREVSDENTIRDLRARVEALEKALEPFAKAAFESDCPNDESIELFYGEEESWHIGTLTLGDLRLARDLLGKR